MGRWLACVILIAGAAVGCSSPSRAPVDASEQPPEVDAAESNSGEFAAGCSKHTDCESGYCVEPVGDTGGVCTRECADDCPTDWECREINLPQVDLKLCVPAAPQLCLACVTDDECGGGVCLDIDGGGRCATPCTTQCATGYACVPDASGMHTGNYCQPVTGSCSCSAGLAGAMRSCSNVNGTGTCFGTQTCDAATGWSTCTARTAVAETCNGTDDDCNFVIDDGLTGGGAMCNNVNGFGSCPGIETCDGPNGVVCFGKTPAMETCNSLDDDCDGTVDDGFTGLGQACTVGVGACTRYGSQRCNTGGTGLTCSAVPGVPATELCNQINDDCDGATDENFKPGYNPPPTNPLGNVCSAGLGVCARYGTNICNASGSGTQCSVMADMTASTTESCNYLDDNCDGNVDNGFRDMTTGVYNTDMNCGACGTNCLTLYTANQSFGACQAGPTSAVCVMGCNNGWGNLNGSTFDGCEFNIDPTAIYVSTTDTTAVDDATCGIGPTGTGTGNHPCKTITQGLTRATATGRANVLVADGTYNEGVTLLDGKNLLGGYRADTWERHLSTTATVIAGFTSAGVHDRTVFANSITSPTVFEGFVVRGSFNSKASGNSYAIYITGSDPDLTIRNNQITAGRGGAGMAGTPGLNGAGGANAAAYSASTYDSFQTANQNPQGSCNTASNRAAYGAGLRVCGGVIDDISGGNGGGNNCTPSRSTQNSTATSPATAGQPGTGAGGGAGGTAGGRGYDSLWAGTSCYVPIQGSSILPQGGTDGGSGLPGAVGAGVSGCTSATGAVMSGEWVNGTAQVGLVGGNGGGGGGGGAGGGADCATSPNRCQIVKNGVAMNVGNGNDILGGHGGGGGSGGCGGGGGGAGGSGGGAFGIFITGGGAPTITGNTVTLGIGGSGGTGGIGGAGGLGGTGSQGGEIGTSQGELLFCSGTGGRGGDGGAGGPASGGGGGCGGSTFGIFSSGVGMPNYCGGNTVGGGAVGTGGAGGFSGGNPGGAGANGVLQNCVQL